MTCAGWRRARRSPAGELARDVTGRASLGLLLGTFVFVVLNSGGVAVAVSLSQRVPLAGVYRERPARCGCRWPASTRSSRCWSSCWPTGARRRCSCSRRCSRRCTPPTAATCTAAHERDVWQQLEGATRELNSLDVTTVVERRAVAQRRSCSRPTSRRSCSTTASGADGLHGRRDGPGRRRGAGPAGRLSRASTAADGDAGALMVYAAPLEGPQGRVGHAASSASAVRSQLRRARAAGPAHARARHQQHRCRTPGSTARCARTPRPRRTRRRTTR